MEVILVPRYRILQNLNAHKELQPNCKTYCRKLYTV